MCFNQTTDGKQKKVQHNFTRTIFTSQPSLRSSRPVLIYRDSWGLITTRFSSRGASIARNLSQRGDFDLEAIFFFFLGGGGKGENTLIFSFTNELQHELLLKRRLGHPSGTRDRLSLIQGVRFGRIQKYFATILCQSLKSGIYYIVKLYIHKIFKILNYQNNDQSIAILKRKIQKQEQVVRGSLLFSNRTSIYCIYMHFFFLQ